MIVTDPYAPHPCKSGSVTFSVRPMSQRELLVLIPELVQGNEVKVGVDIIEKVLSTCLVGWDVDVPFSKDMRVNIDRLDFDEMMDCFNKVMELSKVSSRTVGNLKEQSGDSQGN